MAHRAGRSWADSSDEEDAAHVPENPQAVHEDEEEESSESESETDDEPENEKAVVQMGANEEKQGTGTEAVITGESIIAGKNLSKKERKELKQKEMEDLEALLADFGVSGGGQANEVPAEGDEKAFQDTADDGEGDKAKKKKKKKGQKPRKEENTDTANIEEQASPKAEIKPGEIASILKNKTKKKKSATEAEKVATAAKEAALRAAAAKKIKKKDKAHYNQMPTR